MMGIAIAVAAVLAAPMSAADLLEAGFRNPPPEARPHTYWLWMNGYMHAPSAIEELRAMKDAGLGGVLLFEMGARGDKSAFPPPGPAFLSEPWIEQLKVAVGEAKRLGLQVDMSVISSWDLGGPWIDPAHATMALYATETSVEGGAVETKLPFPTPERTAPLGPDGRPAFWTDVAVLALREPKRLPAHEFVFRLDPPGVSPLTSVVLDQGRPNAAPEIAATMTPVNAFAVDVSETGTHDSDFKPVLDGQLAAAAGPQRFALPPGTRARYVRLRLLSGHDASRPSWTLGEFEVYDASGHNLAASHAVNSERDGAGLVRAPMPRTYYDWKAGNIHNGSVAGPGGVFATAGLPPFDVADARDFVDVTSHVDREGRLRWSAPAGKWTILRYVCAVTGEKLKVPSPASDGYASDHLNPEATRLHMNRVVAQLKKGFGDNLAQSGITNCYLASYEVVGKVWSPVFAAEFKRRRGYELSRYLPAIFGARIGGAETTERFLFDYEKTLSEVFIDAYYRTAAEVAHAAGLQIKSEAGGPGPPIHTPPVDALLANGALDDIQGEFWPFRPHSDALNVIKEPASSAHIYGKRLAHLESFTSFNHWAEGPQDLKASADRVFCEGGNHFVWHTWTHQSPEAGAPGWVYGAGTHLNRNVTWWPKAPAFLAYLSRGSFLLQRGHFVADVLYFYGESGANFVGPRRNPPTLGPGYDYDVTNADVILHRLAVKDGRLVLPDGMSYRVLVLPERDDLSPALLAKIEQLVRAGATVVGPRPTRASGLEGFPASDARVRELAARLWGDLDGKTPTMRDHGRGRIVQGRAERVVLETLGIGPDFVGPPALDFIHRRDGETDIYFVCNRETTAFEGSASFRVPDRLPEFWDPRTGTISEPAVYRRTGEAMQVPLRLAAHGSIFVVFRQPAQRKAMTEVSPAAAMEATRGGSLLVTDKPGVYKVSAANGAQREVRVAALPDPIALDADWAVTFSSRFDAPAPLSLAHVAPWTQGNSSELKYFSGSGRYRRTFDLPAEWRTRAPRVELDFGRLWAIGEVWLNGQSLGVLWTEPFRVDCTAALRDGANEVVVEVIGTWHNRLVGEARGLLPKKTRTNIQQSQRKSWKDLEPIPTGLFGPVRLVPLAVQPVGE